MNRFGSTTLAITLLATLSASAKVMPHFDNVDGNDDGFINKVEAKGSAVLREFFGELDRNKDFQIDESEFARLKTLVTNANQKSGRPELPKRRRSCSACGIVSDATTAIAVDSLRVIGGFLPRWWECLF